MSKTRFFICYSKDVNILNYNIYYHLEDLKTVGIKLVEDIPDVRGETTYSDIITNKITSYDTLLDLLIHFSFWFDNEFNDTYSNDAIIERLELFNHNYLVLMKNINFKIIKTDEIKKLIVNIYSFRHHLIINNFGITDDFIKFW